MAGNSKYDKIDLDQVRRLAGLGFIDREISSILGVSEKTLNNWKQKPEFREALQAGKAVSDEKVLQALFNKATGHYVDEEKVINLGGGKQGKLKVRTYYPPDTTAIIFWTKNRRSDFRDNKDSSTLVDLSEVARAMDDQDGGPGKADPGKAGKESK